VYETGCIYKVKHNIKCGRKDALAQLLLLIDAELKQGTALGFLIKLYKLRA
jgi:hypothetical protein